MSRSGVGLALLTVGRPCADDADRFFAMGCSPYCVHEQKNPTSNGLPEPLEAAFVLGVREVFPVQTVRISKDGRCLLEWDTVFVVVLNGLPDVPREHIPVYT